jgi:hypothetical protein
VLGGFHDDVIKHVYLAYFHISPHTVSFPFPFLSPVGSLTFLKFVTPLPNSKCFLECPSHGIGKGHLKTRSMPEAELKVFQKDQTLVLT